MPNGVRYKEGKHTSGGFPFFNIKNSKILQPTLKKPYLIGEGAKCFMKGDENMDDSKIIELYFDRDERAIKETQDKYGKLIFGIANNMLNSREDADECVNDTYLGVWNSIPPLRPISFRAFVCKIARNVSLKRLEYESADKRGRNLTVSLSELEGVLCDSQIAPDVTDGEISRLISDFLRSESKIKRDVFIRRYYFFDSIEDIAKRYSFSQSKVKSMLFHTRRKLKDFLEKEGIEI